MQLEAKVITAHQNKPYCYQLCWDFGVCSRRPNTDEIPPNTQRCCLSHTNGTWCSSILLLKLLQQSRRNNISLHKCFCSFTDSNYYSKQIPLVFKAKQLPKLHISWKPLGEKGGKNKRQIKNALLMTLQKLKVHCSQETSSLPTLFEAWPVFEMQHAANISSRCLSQNLIANSEQSLANCPEESYSWPPHNIKSLFRP